MQIGTIINWHEEKGVGFIAPGSGGKNIFVHINDYSRLHKSWFKGLEVQYLLSADQKDRKCAVEVCPLKGNKKSSRGLKQKIFSIVLFSSFSYVLFVLFNSNSIPIELIGLFTAMSVISFIKYIPYNFRRIL